MTYDEIQAGLASIELAARTRGLRNASAMFMISRPKSYETAHCALSLWYDPLLKLPTDAGSRMFYGISAGDAFAKAANWIAGVRLWTAEDVGRTLGVAAE